MIRIEGIPVVAARLADAERAKSRRTRKNPNSHVLPIVLRPGSSGKKYLPVRSSAAAGRGTM
jgi:hypothetical protein